MARPKPVPERNATGDIDRVYHEIKQTLRVSGVTLNFRTLAGYKNVLPLLWDELRPNLETREFEDDADRIRVRAAQLARLLLPSRSQPRMLLGESQRYHIQNALKLYHYINPKLLLLMSALKVSLHGENIGRDHTSPSSLPLIALGIPAKMYPLEMAGDPPEDQRVTQAFEDIKHTLSLPAVNSEYHTLALWPDYLVAGWERQKPLIRSSKYQEAAEELRQLSVHLARHLPLPMALSLRRIGDVGENPEHVLRTIERFESLLPALLLNNCVLLLDWFEEEELKRSPFPAATRRKILRPEAQAV
jgi:hypothetical protein